MSIKLSPDAPKQFPQWIRLAQVLSERDVIDTLTFKAQSIGQINISDAEDAIIAVFAWRDITNYPSIVGSGQANMYDLVEIADKLGIDISIGGVASLAARLEQVDFIMIDSPSEAVSPDAQFAYLNAGGLERGLSVLGRMYEARLEGSQLEAPSAFGTVSLDHNRPEFQEAVRQTEQAIEAIRQSNTLPVEERETWLPHLVAGLALLSKPKVYLSAISLLLLQPLYSAYSSIIEDAAKPLLEAAIHAIKHLVGF